MTEITHKQAIKWIDRRLDGMLTEGQLFLLDEHLHSCDTCRAYAIEMDSVPARLQHEFRARWDPKPGPSPRVMQHVTTKARNIPMTNRISSGLKLLAGAAALFLLGFAINFVVSQLPGTSRTAAGTEMVNVPPRAEDRLLAFTSNQNGNSDIYTMLPDGSRLINLTNNPANDEYPFWSPDGKHIAFMSDRDGSVQIYLMDADGSNVVQLTEGDGRHLLDVNGFSPWSPDDRKLIFARMIPEERSWKLYVLDINEKTSIELTPEPGEYIIPSWSPDGTHIAFASSPSSRMAREIYVVDKNGGNFTHLTQNLPRGEFFMFGNYSWSPDGRYVIFTADVNGTQRGPYQSTVYKTGLDGSLAIITGSDKSIYDWWNGTTLLRDFEGTHSFIWLRPDGSQSTLDLCSADEISGIAHERSHNGASVLGLNCSDGWMLYWANSDGTIVDKLLDSPIPSDSEKDNIFGMTWSQDDRFIAFLAWDTGGSGALYILDIEKARNDPSLEPLKMEGSYGPSWQPIPRPFP
jgi:hypothetical protein